MIIAVARKNLFYFLFLGVTICLLYSKYVLSMATIALLFLSIFSEAEGHKTRFKLNPNLFSWDHLKKFGSYYLGFLLLFLWICLSIIWSNDIPQAMQEIVSKLSLLGIPLIMILSPRFNKREILHLHFFFYSILVISGFFVLWVYLSDIQRITDSISMGQSIPTPIDHVRFSLMIAYGALSSIGFLTKSSLLNKTEKQFLYISFGLFFVLLHFLAVRSGILVFYTGMLLVISFLIYKKKKYKLGIIMLLAIITIPFLATKTIPSLTNKFKYSIYDFKQSMMGEGASYSDGERMNSIRDGWSLWKENFIFGTGAGDYKNEYEVIQLQADNEYHHFLPHNQYIRTGMAYGLIGVILLLFGMLLPMFKTRQKSNILLILLIQMYLISFLVESNFERYYSLSFFFFFLGWIIMYTESQDNK